MRHPGLRVWLPFCSPSRTVARMLPYPALHASHAGIWIADADGARAVGRGEAIRRAADTPMIVLNAPLVGQRLGYAELSGLDLLELFAFLHPARFCRRRRAASRGWSGLRRPTDEAQIAAVPARCRRARCSRSPTATGPSARARGPRRRRSRGCAGPGRRCSPIASRGPHSTSAGCSRSCPNGTRPRPAPPRAPVTLDDGEVADAPRLPDRRAAPSSAPASAPMPKPPPPRSRRAMMRDNPNMLLAEAGTGIGKTLGYLAPASLWAEQAGGAVWVSTFTKALQRQLDHETARLFPDAAERRATRRDAQGPRELSLPAQPRGCAAGRVRRARRDPRAARRALGGVSAPTATWSAATCPAGCRRCSAATARPR